MPKASIVIRTFNEEKHLGNLLRAIRQQDFKEYEIVVVDSGSTDRTLQIAEEFGVKVLKIESRDFTFGYALNIGCVASVGDFLVFVSAHIVPVNNQWLSNLLAPFHDKNIAMVYGRQVGTDESKFSERMDFRRLFGLSSVNSNLPLSYANNANSAIRKNLWQKRHFDEYLFGLEDIDWARSLTQQGFFIHYEPSAAIYHIHEEKWSQVFNRYRREAIAAVRIGLHEPPQVKLGTWSFLNNIVHDLFSSFPAVSMSRIEEILRFRYYQWKGSRIGWLQGKDIDFDIVRNSLFFPSGNWSVVIQGPGKAEYMETAIPEMRPGDILLKVEYVGICRTDLEVYEGTLGYYRDGVAAYPIVPGHEFSGVITKIGSNNKFQERFKIGDRVVGECILSRGETGERKEVGVINVNGAYSQYVVAPGDAIHKIPETVDSKKAVLAEPLAVVLRSLRRIESRVKPESRIAVIGAGQIGNMSAQVLTLRGHQVTLFDTDTDRLRLLENTIHDVQTTITDLSTFGMVVEATGSKIVLEQVLQQTTVDATVLLLGFPYGDIQYNFEDVVGKEKMIVGSVGADGVDFEAALELIPKLNMEPFVQNVLPLEKYDSAWKELRASKHLKIILQP
jgi:2-desacetyl-2-hydroxyethyl bacteriochlorophyllide A dehydrogenase